jgi:hypothetical protein
MSELHPGMREPIEALERNALAAEREFFSDPTGNTRDAASRAWKAYEALCVDECVCVVPGCWKVTPVSLRCVQHRGEARLGACDGTYRRGDDIELCLRQAVVQVGKLEFCEHCAPAPKNCRCGAFYIGDDDISRCTDCDQPYRPA